MKIIPIPANTDNYQYLIIDTVTRDSAIVDPVDVPAIFKTASEEAGPPPNQHQLKMALVTHHHWDHAGGTGELAKEMRGKEGGYSRDFRVYGGDVHRIEAITDVLDLDKCEPFKLGSLRITPILTPCHTSTHVCYYVEEDRPTHKERAVFTGDTLFIGGCGRFFEGTAQQMNEALNVKLAALPGDTRVYCGHEYTVANLKFARSVEPSNMAVVEKLRWAEKERRAGRYTVPSTIGEERFFNPFMRVDVEQLQRSLGVKDSIAAMAKLREMKNNF